MAEAKEIHIIGGGTVFHVRPHMAISAPAYGKTAKTLKALILAEGHEQNKVHLHLTKMAGGDKLETNEDVGQLVDQLVSDPKPKVIIMNAALCDFEGFVCKGHMGTTVKFGNDDNEEDDELTCSGKDQPRLKTSEGDKLLKLVPAKKIIGNIRKERKDIFLVGFKTTAGATQEEQYEAGMNLLKQNSCNLVLANDMHTRCNMVLTPEMATYGNTTDRFEALEIFAKMILSRSTNEFTRTEVISEKPIDWPMAPGALREVVEYCVEKGAYKPFNGKTVGHFGYCPNPSVLLSSRRKQNYNEPGGLDLALVKFSRDGKVTSQGGKPSAGVRSQYELLRQYKQFNCVVHFHCPMKPGAEISTRPQMYYECGSHQCGENTAAGIELHVNGQIGAVMLDKHGPNILFHDKIDPAIVKAFIEENFDLTQTTK